MAFVNVPKDLTKVKSKLIFNLTKRQLICFSIAAAIGIPFYLLTRSSIGTTLAAAGMVMLMMPAFLFAMYERDGLPLEKIIGNIIRTKYKRGTVRRYKMTNRYERAALNKNRKGAGHGKKRKA